ncbi:uncharacterized protein F4822DRAFT_38506 [Hypoxylon trugodes]|uniref:uncharacterized protein n=1 Tax=Hypoxylon trugodes TaxID=326681 RepID=UPI00219E3AA7|nr:uncharacterized protein F4822DRAFT_38506 [Hypoxylon trugodes]KAI1394147.1 hypothetical protein F4822DRAFT_38506 [Hypoxylon trugodes]
MASAGNHHGHEPYSTLEVYVGGNEASAPEVVNFSNTNKEVVNQPENVKDSQIAPGAATGLGIQDFGKEVANRDPGKEEAAVPGQDDGTTKRRICGLSPRLFYIILAVALIIIAGAIAGGVAGGLAGRSSKSTSSSGSSLDPNTSGSSAILSNSSLAASNWTDPDGNIHRTVFFQDEYSHIIARQWDSQNKTWMTRNITELVQPSTSGPISPLPGTSLASASRDIKQGSVYDVSVFFSELSGDAQTISQAASYNPIGNPDSWTYNTSSLRTWNDTQIAAAWQRCPRDNCPGYWAIAYQGRQGYVRVGNSSNWGSDSVIKTSAVTARASIALLPALNGTNLDGLTLATQRIPGSIVKSTLKQTGNWTQNDGTILDDVNPSDTRQFAATSMNNWNEALFLALSTDGGVKAARWDGKAYNAVPEINFAQAQSTNFSAIAMTTDAMFYGIADEQIWEYSVDTTDPSVFTLVGKVYP